MGILTEINRILAAVSAAYAKVLAKGGKADKPYSVDALASAIDTIPVGEEVTAETNAYTDLLAELEAVVNAIPD